MYIKRSAVFAAVFGFNVLIAPAATAQEAPAGAEPSRAAVGPEWRVLSRAPDRNYLIDLSSRAPVEDAVSIRVARISRTSATGDYSHTIETFAVRCDADQTHVVESTDVAEDGETSDTYASEEPWADVEPGTLDAGIKQIACEEARLDGTAFTTIRAYFDAGRP